MVKKKLDKKKIVVIIQARLGSTRFPSKILKRIGKKTALEFLIDRLKKSKKYNELIVATTKRSEDHELLKVVESKKVSIFQGSEKNVLKRFFDASCKYSADIIVRITADCPFVDYSQVDKMISIFKSSEYDYISNTNPPTFPDGFDIEIFSHKILREANLKAEAAYDKEHVTPYIIRNARKKFNFSYKKDYSKFRLTLDEPNDLRVLNQVYDKIKDKNKFVFKDIENLIKKNKNIFIQNMNVKRNIGGKISTGQKMWIRAKNIIPGGNMLLSKRPEMFLPGLWPAYFSKAKGCYVWDLDKKKYFDLSTMSVGTNLLGYSNNKVDNAVIKSVKNGNMSSLNCKEEVILAEKLLKMHNNFEMVRFAKTGGEANAISIRIARAFVKKDNIAVCGYHGWHDWYLSANLKSKKNLNEHHLKGLSVSGVPKKLQNTVFPFKYNDIQDFYKVCSRNNIGIVKMEVHRNFLPKNEFLIRIRNYCKKNNIILIFDECTSGFRETFGGIHLKYKVYPDICILGKALGNGYPITAIMGSKKIMQAAQSTFISSTFWTERTGYAAALKTLEIMEKEKSWLKVKKIGTYIKKRWREIALKHKLKININGLSAIPSFTLSYKNWLSYKSYISFKMLKSSILASNLIFLSVNHNKKNLKKYFKVLDLSFKEIKNFEKGKNLELLKKIPICHDGFKRLN